MSIGISTSGLHAAQQIIESRSNNVANVSTHGFKGAIPRFHALVAHARDRDGSIASGQGTRAAGLSMNFSQGAIERTGRPLDIAIEGDGFFVLRSLRTTDPRRVSADRVDSPSALARIANDYNSELLFENDYVRTRRLFVDTTGYVVDSDGRRLKTGLGPGGRVFTKLDPLESAITEPGWINTEADYVKIPRTLGAAQATQKITVGAVFGSREPIIDSNIEFSPDDRESFNFSSDLLIYGAGGESQVARLFYRKAAGSASSDRASTWQTFLSVDGRQYRAEANGLEFDSRGSLLSPSSEQRFSLTAQVVVPPSVPSRTDPFSKEPLPPPSPGGLVTSRREINVVFDRTMTFSTLPDSKVGVQRQDGYPPGVVEQLVVERDGTLRAELSNGRAEKIAQVKLARFVNPSRLKQVGDGVFKPTSESGMPKEGVAGTDGFGAVIGSALEQSNTNLVDELSVIVQCQLAFTANSSAIDKQSAMVKSLIDKV